MNKKQARAHARSLVEGMSVSERQQESRALCAHLSTEGVILAFSPLRRWEPDIRARLDQVAQLVLPRVTSSGLSLHRCDRAALVRSPRFGLLEPPADAPRVDPQSVDTVWVPGWAFGLDGGRLGKGGGFYDRLLPQIRARRLALCFGCQVWETVPVQPHDARVHALVTAQGIRDVWAGPQG